MSYKYSDHVGWLSTLAGQREFLRVRDWVAVALRDTGAFTLGCAIAASCEGDSFKRIAIVDRLVELGEVEEIPGQTCYLQHRVYRRGRSC